MTFDYEVDFLNNEALHDGDYDAGNGGALAIGAEGDVRRDYIITCNDTPIVAPDVF